MISTEQKILTFHEIGEISKDGVFTYDRTSSTFRYVNGRFAKMFGLTEQALLDDPSVIIEKIIPDDLAYLKHVFSRLGRKHFFEVEFKAKTTTAVKHFYADVYFFGSQNLLAGFVKDMTGQKEHEQYIINYGAKKDTLLEMLAHNLSGPLRLSQKVIGAKAGRTRSSGQTQEEQLAFVREVNQQCIDIIHEFLKEEHFLSERIYIKRQRFDVIEKVRVVVEQYRASHADRLLEFTKPSDELFVTGDDVRFMQIVNNLLSNAVKFTPPNCFIRISIVELATLFQLTVSDDGIGIPPHLQPLVYQKYTPAGRTGLNGEKSIGIGLSIVKNLVELMEGKIEFTSSEKKGTTFVVTLPKL